MSRCVGSPWLAPWHVKESWGGVFSVSHMPVSQVGLEQTDASGVLIRSSRGFLGSTAMEAPGGTTWHSSR